jgi:hypothetical protein
MGAGDADAALLEGEWGAAVGQAILTVSGAFVTELQAESLIFRTLAQNDTQCACAHSVLRLTSLMANLATRRLHRL